MRNTCKLVLMICWVAFPPIGATSIGTIPMSASIICNTLQEQNSVCAKVHLPKQNALHSWSKFPFPVKASVVLLAIVCICMNSIKWYKAEAHFAIHDHIHDLWCLTGLTLRQFDQFGYCESCVWRGQPWMVSGVPTASTVADTLAWNPPYRLCYKGAQWDESCFWMALSSTSSWDWLSF